MISACRFAVREHSDGMARAKLKLILPVIQVVIAGGLLILGSRQVPTVMQDDPPFVPSAVNLCYAINAPVAVWEVGFAVLLQKTHLRLGRSQRTASDAFLLGGVASLWFLIIPTVELQLRTFVTPARLLSDIAAFVFGVFLAFLAVAAWKRGE